MTYTLKREIPMEDGYDVVVAGGGPAGSAAAICAAGGARVLLLEAQGCLGGMGTSGMVCAYDPMADGEKMLVGGFMRELIETLYARGFTGPRTPPESWRSKYMCWTNFRPEGLKLVLDELVVKEGVEVRFFTRVIDAEADPQEGVVQGVVTSSVEGYRYIRAKTFIDCTGDAILAGLAGAKYRQAGRDTEHIMPATLPGLFSGVDWDKPDLNTQTPEAVELIEKEYAAGNFEQCDRLLVGLSCSGNTFGYLNGGHIFDLDALSVESLTKGMMQGRRIALQNLAFLRKYSPNCENLELVYTAPVMGVRESRRIVGEYELTFADYLARRQFPDQIGLFNKYVDVHPYSCSKEDFDRHLVEKRKSGILSPGECFGIPYGILVPKGWKNFWVAGRCNSSDVMVHGDHPCDALLCHDGPGGGHSGGAVHPNGPGGQPARHGPAGGDPAGKRRQPSPEGIEQVHDRGIADRTAGKWGGVQGCRPAFSCFDMENTQPLTKASQIHYPIRRGDWGNGCQRDGMKERVEQWRDTEC